MEWDTHEFQSRIYNAIGSEPVTHIYIEMAACSTGVFVELLDRISRQHKPETGFESFGFSSIWGLEKALDEHTTGKLIDNCKQLVAFEMGWLDKLEKEALDSLLRMGSMMMYWSLDSLQELKFWPYYKKKVPAELFEYIKYHIT